MRIFVASSLSREQKRLADPAGAERRIRERIEVDLAVEREPAPDPAADPVISSSGGVRLINDLPGLAPLRLHDRDGQLQRLKLLLAGSATRLIALTGRDGMGKTALLTRLRDNLGHEGLTAMNLPSATATRSECFSCAAPARSAPPRAA